MDQRHIQHYKNLIAQNPDKKDLILDGAYALYSSGNPVNSPPDLDTILNYGKQYRADQPPEIVKGFKKATQEMQASGFGALGLVGSAVGSDKLRDYGYEGYRRNMEEAEQIAPRVNRVEDIGGFGDAADWFMGTLGSLGPSVIEAGAAALAGGGVGGLVAKKTAKEAVETAVEKYVAKKVAEGVAEKEARQVAMKTVADMAKKTAVEAGEKTVERGRNLGLVAGVAPVESGSMFGQAADDVGIENAKPLTAAGLGLVSAASEVLGPEGKLVTQGVAKMTRREALKHVPISMVKQGAQETFQQGLGDVNAKINNPDAEISGSGYLNAFAAGAVGGSAFSAPSVIRSWGNNPAKGAKSEVDKKDPRESQDLLENAKNKGLKKVITPEGDKARPVVQEELSGYETPLNEMFGGVWGGGSPAPNISPVAQAEFQAVEPVVDPAPVSPVEPVSVDQAVPVAPVDDEYGGMGLPSVNAPISEPVVSPVQVMPEDVKPVTQNKPAGLKKDITKADITPTVQSDENTPFIHPDDNYQYILGTNGRGVPAVLIKKPDTGETVDTVVFDSNEQAEKSFKKLKNEAENWKAEKPQEKEPWQMTNDEFLEYAEKETGKKRNDIDNEGLNPGNKWRNIWTSTHESAVVEALATGKSVSPEILARYPKAEKEAAKRRDFYKRFEPWKLEPGQGVHKDERKTDKENQVSPGNLSTSSTVQKSKINVPDGVNLASSGNPYSKRGAQKAAATHSKTTGSKTEIVDVGEDRYGWRVVDEVKESPVDTLAHEAATSPTNDRPEPTVAQKEAGNYKKGHVSISGMDIAIENPEGSSRSGVSEDGKKWETKMNSHYGYFKRTEGKDGDQVDVFVRPGTAGVEKVHIVDQIGHDGKFDEHKVVLGAKTKIDARKEYLKNYEKGWKPGPVSEMSVDDFKAWLKDGKRSKEPVNKDFFKEKLKRLTKEDEDHLFGKDKDRPGLSKKPTPEKPVELASDGQRSLKTPEDSSKGAGEETPPASQDRRQDADRRKNVSEMSPDEMKRELLTDYLTGLGNKRAYEEAPKKAHQVSIDADALKWVNDNLGHQAGDELLKQIGNALKQDSLEAYHISGDEYYLQGDDVETLESSIKKAYAYLKDNPIEVTLPDGTKALFTGGFSYGRGQNIEEAERRLQLHKTERELSGERAVRGQEPTGSIKRLSEGNKNQDQREDVHDLKEKPESVEKPSEESATEPYHERKGSSYSLVAEWVKSKLEKHEPFTSKELFGKADESFGGTQGQGAYSVKDAYDAMELGVNKYVSEKKITPNVSVEDAKRIVGELSSLTKSLATQTKRTDEQIKYQQFSTPPALAFAANWVADIKPDDTVLEPSAGIGGLAVFAKNAGATVHVNELSLRRAKILELMNFDGMFTEDGEQINNILPDTVRPTVVVMNPPFSSTAGRLDKNKTMNGARHVEQALLRLEDGGRLVAIVGDGMGMDAPTFKAWWNKIGKKYNVVANIGVSGKDYAKYGTTFDNRLIVIDKTGETGKTLTESVDSYEELIGVLSGIREANRHGETKRDQRGEQVDSEQAVKSGTDSGQGTGGHGQGSRISTDGVGSGKQGGRPERNNRKSSVPHSDSQPGSDAEGVRDDRAEVPGRSKGAGADAVSNSEQLDTGKDSGLQLRSPEAADRELTDSVYDHYVPNAKIQGSKSHITPLVESAAMADTTPPKAKYSPNLPKSSIEKGLITDAQLEPVIYAGMAHSEFLASGERKGFFIGDGTGVGKGREIASVILDNWRNGRKKAIWLSEKASLLNDAKRDLAGIGWREGAEKVFGINSTKLGEPIQHSDGILFTQYATLRGKFEDIREDAPGTLEDMNIRLNQIVKWAGSDFDGVIAFDEAHNMGNAVAIKGKRGVVKPANQALAGIMLQKLLPNARVVYVSATGATEVKNLAYAPRLGLWGKGTPFKDVNDFVSKISGSGIAAMELVARDMKALGLYVARSLSYADVKYDRIEHPLSTEQTRIYDTLASGWQTVLKNIDEAIEVTDGGRNARSAALSQFWGAHQRFFNQIITALQMPSALAQMEKDIESGNSIVVQLVNTNASQLEKNIAMNESGDIEDIDMTPRETLMGFIDKSFPTKQYEKYTDENGNELTRVVVDSNGEPVHNREALEMKKRLMAKLGSISVPDTALDMIVHKFGPDIVAEVTGRNRRVIIDKNGKKQIEKRSDAKGEKEIREFMDDKRRILIFSEKGGTGSSYHASLDAKNQRLRRHYLVQPGWRADKAVQGLGRSHRSFQKQAPEFILVTTDLPGQKRFLSSIARRLDQLGALTKGQRQTGSGGVFAARDNLESDYARDALTNFFDNLVRGNYDNLNFRDFEKQTGITLVDDNGVREFPEMTQFLNRMLSMTKDMQNRVFERFSKELDTIIQTNSDLGQLDTGLETLKADSVKKISEETAYRDNERNLEAKYIQFELKHPARHATFKEVSQKASDFYINKTNGKVRVASKVREKTDLKTGSINKVVDLQNPRRNYVSVSLEELSEKWEKIGKEKAKSLWNSEYNDLPRHNTEIVHLLTGTLLPLWDRFSGRISVARLQTDEGERFLGQKISSDSINDVLGKLGMGQQKIVMNGDAVAQNVLAGGSVKLHNGVVFKRSLVAGEHRIEYKNDSVGYMSSRDMKELEDYGLFSEEINWKVRWFVPTDDRAGEVIDKILVGKDIISAQMAVRKESLDGAKFSKSSPLKNPSSISELTPKQRRIVRQLQAKGKVKAVTAKEAMAILEGAGVKIIEKYSKDGRIQGFALPDGRAFIIPENIEAGKLWGVVRHEVGVHLGRLMQNDKGFDRLKRAFEAKRNDQTPTGEAIRAAYAKVPEDTPAAHVTEEAMAYLVASAPEMGFVKRILNFIKRMMVKLGMSPEIFTADDYVVMAEAALRREAKGNPSSMTGNDVETPLYSIADTKDHLSETFNETMEYLGDLYSRRGDLVTGIKGAVKYWNAKHPGDKADVTWFEKAFGLVSHYSKKIPAFARTFNHALRNQDIKIMVEQQLTHGENGEKFIEIIDRFRRKSKDEYNRLSDYLNERDMNKRGYTVKEKDERFVVRDLGGKDTDFSFETEKEALEKAIALEVDDFIRDGGSQDAAEALALIRTINNRSFELRIQRFREVEQMCKDNGIEIPEIVYVENGNEIRVDLKQKLIEMGDMRGFYMPRIRKPGEHMLYATKRGQNPVLKYYDTRFFANAAKANFEKQGYSVTVRQAGKLSEDLFEQLGSVMAQQAVINESMKEINKGSKVVTFEDINIKKTMDGDTLVLSGEFKDEFIPTLEKMGGTKKIRTRLVGKTKVVTIEYRFENPKKGLEQALANELFKIDGVTNMFQTVALRFAGAFVSQYADMIRSRGSRSAMIGRTEAVGEDVTIGYEEDALTRVTKATLSLAGGEAKAKTALAMVQAITGRDVSWADFSEIKRFEGDFEAYEKMILDSDRPYIDRDTFNEIKNNWVEAPQYPDYIEFINGRGIDPAKQKTAHSEAMAMFKDMMRNEERVDRVIGTMKGLAVLKYLGFRVAAPVVNMTNMVVGVPAAMMGYGNINAKSIPALIGNAYRDYRKFKTKALEPGELQNVFAEIEKRGWDQAQFNHEGLAAIQNKMQFGYSKMIETSMMLFSWSEKLNRVATITAAYNGLLESEPGMTFEERLNRAKEISDKAHGIYGKANRPSMMRGGSVGANVMQSFYVFKTFTHNFLATMYDLGVNKKDAKAVAWMLFSPAIFGVGASMGTSALIQAIGRAMGSDDPEEDFYKAVESRFGSYAGNFSRFGIFGTLENGISVKGSLNAVGVSDLPTSLGDIMGVPGSVLSDIVDGVGQIGRGNVMKGVESILPLAAGSPIKAYREYTEGITTKSNAPVFFEGKPLKADAIDAFLRAFSFNPSRIAGAREKLWGERTAEQAFLDRRQEIYARLKKHYIGYDRDYKELQDINIMIAAYNARAKRDGQKLIQAKNIKAVLKKAKVE